jgi:deazaflavin-dependent oxidoreductase (nitroreductase family)
MSEFNDFNTTVIAEFRANGGKVTEAGGGVLSELDLAIVHHIGRRSGKQYLTPVSYMTFEGDFLLIGSYAGSPVEPQWVANVEAMAELELEFGDRTVRVIPAVLREGTEWERLYAAAVAHWPFVAEDYARKTTRAFPVIRLTPVGADMTLSVS